MASKFTGSQLKGKADAFIADTISKRGGVKARSDHKTLIDNWIASMSTKTPTLNTILENESEKGRRMYVLSSPVFENPGTVKDVGGNNQQRAYREKEFRDYLKSLITGTTIEAELAKHVGTGISVTEIAEPAVAASAAEPLIPANVVFRYKISW